jgi:hypothetical protein
MKRKVSEGSKDDARRLAGIADRLWGAEIWKGTADFASFTSKFNQASADAKAITRLYMGNYPELKAEIDKANEATGAVSVDAITSTLERRKADLDALRGTVGEAKLTMYSYRLEEIGNMDLGGMTDKERTDVLGELFSMRGALEALRREAAEA